MIIDFVVRLTQFQLNFQIAESIRREQRQINSWCITSINTKGNGQFRSTVKQFRIRGFIPHTAKTVSEQSGIRCIY